MNFHPRRREEPDINLTSLIDVVLTVLLFFIVTTSFRKESELRVELPVASTQPPVTTTDRPTLEVAIDAQGRYYIDNQPLVDATRATLWNALTQRAGERRDQTFVIRAAAQTPYQAVVTVMDVAGRLGFRHLAIPTAQRGREPVSALDEQP